ncbi:MAG: tetratricopeptide repeat protein [candidate division Zixibacteria bacterium]|nr:tetratricopeptide repeat protein [candidate division Zixibacteria bacterium]
MKFIKLFFAAALIFSFVVGELEARKIQFEVTVRERDTAGDYKLVAKQPLTITENVKNTSFISNFTLDLSASYNDSGFYLCEFSLYTIGPHSQTLYKKFQSFPGGVYFVDNVRLKNQVVYRVGISPLSIDSVSSDLSDCGFNFREEGVWRFDPSAHFDLYFVNQTLGDARWNQVRDYLELNYKDFKKRFDPTFPGKVNCFLSPCILPEVTWDERSGYAIDPARFNCMMLYSGSYNTIDPFPVFLVRIYRFMGYAPPLLSEGLAGYYDFPHYYARKLKQDSELPPLSMTLKSIDYYSLPGHNNISIASSFSKFLIDSYGFNQFKQLYEKATDLTLAGSFEEIYKKPLEVLEDEWHSTLDTVSIGINHFRYYYERDEYIYNKAGMNRFLDEFKSVITTTNDTLFVYAKEAWNRYMDGEFDSAITIYQKLLPMDPTNNTYNMVYGNLMLIDGRYDSAIAIYDNLYSIDSSMKTIFYKKGEAYLRNGNLDSATAYFRKDLEEGSSPLSQASSGIWMGRISLAAGDTTMARDYYADALDEMEQIYQFGKARPAFLLRLGQAHLGLAMCDKTPLATAKSFLEQAKYFEVHPTRVIFGTRILHELGKIADLEGRRDEAISYYQEAMTYSLSPFIDAEIRQLLSQPFTGY